MATFVLVHGAWQGGWCWKYVAKRLRRFGHEVFTPTLTGLGERAHLLNERTDLDTHIEDVSAVLESEELSDIVLCGHSYGGMIITGVADKTPEKICSLVYLDALLPADGQSVLDVLPSESASNFRENAKTRESVSRIPPVPAEAFGVNAEDQAWLDRHCVDQPLKSFEQEIRLDGRWKEVPRHVYIYATGWGPAIGKPFFEYAQQEAGWRAVSLPSGHYVMVDMPHELTQILIDSI